MNVYSIYVGQLALANTLRLKVNPTPGATTVVPGTKLRRSAIAFLTKYRGSERGRS